MALFIHDRTLTQEAGDNGALQLAARGHGMAKTPPGGPAGRPVLFLDVRLRAAASPPSS
jgi:hypothetical protein